MPGISSSLTLCADEHPRGNFEEDPSERRTGTMRRILRQRRRKAESERERKVEREGGREEIAEGPAREWEAERWRLAPGGSFVRQ